MAVPCIYEKGQQGLLIAQGSGRWNGRAQSIYPPRPFLCYRRLHFEDTARHGEDKAGQDGAGQTRMGMNHGKRETFGRPRGLKPSRQEVQFQRHLILDLSVPRGQEEKRRR